MPPASSTIASFAHSTAPAARSFVITVASWSNTCFRYGSAPHVVGTPLVASRSLTPNGMPWSGPLCLPFLMSASAARASPSADSRISVTTAFSCGPSFSSPSRHTSASFTGETWRDFTRAPSSRTGRYIRSESAMASSGAEGGIGFVSVRELGCAQPLGAAEVAVDVADDARPLLFLEAIGIARAQHFGEESRLVAGVLGRRGCGGGRRRGRGCGRGLRGGHRGQCGDGTGDELQEATAIERARRGGFGHGVPPGGPGWVTVERAE